MRLYAWWNAWPGRAAPAGRCVVVRRRLSSLFSQGALFETAAITNKEWFYCHRMLVLIMLGTINIRMRRCETPSGTFRSIDPNLRSRK